MLLTILVFIIILSVLVLVHELGHFLVAKKLGIKVEEFGFGFPPRVFAKKIGETLYSINLLPIGGFVKLYGEDEAGGGSMKVKGQGLKIKDKDLNRAFFARPVWQRALVVVAGVLMNFLLAVIIISYLYTAQGVPSLGDKVIVTQVVKNSPASLAGLRNGDVILEINNKKVSSTVYLIEETKKYLGKQIVLEIKRGSKDLKIIVTPRVESPTGEGPMGVAISQSVTVKKYPWYKAPFIGTYEVAKSSILILSGLSDVVKNLILQKTVPQGVAGPVGIAQLTGEFVESGYLALLSFTALLSLNLAVLNILPIPALDGGRLFFIMIEAVTRRKVNPRFEAYAHAIGIAVLLALIAIITLHDFIRIFQGKPILPQ
ncbi:MAG: membrane-associated zinc metalloprotease [Microgenomates group bacterium GW2011_GWC1_38_14]|nr:MAG: Membrane-associated zinc metalloprotease [Candidatus Levybacteria bacterium GW2011_GWA2_36_13]KKQ57926.1 MAG: membrane-associated zinc metalloprotease [Microgenomates group bacterium GW2011_GWC1_38_14]KKR15737.1 MAG: Membrane-associated zinc metalloprotease [Candidatus Levybacteria bacterium GW2011_GWA1_39_34]OGH43523.1 MAG: RIP metalloprotease RseP [Candidatus Levybacteria bacterium RIFCSPLOWO2_02_FULL_37_11]